MNSSTMIFLINDDTRCVAGTYEAEEGAPRTLFKTMDQDLKVGDFVIVQSGTRHDMTVVKIVETDIEPDFDSSKEMKWVIGRIELEDFEKLQKMEAKAIEMIQSAEKRRRRDELRKSVFYDQQEKMRELGLTKLDGDALPAPEAPRTTPAPEPAPETMSPIPGETPEY